MRRSTTRWLPLLVTPLIALAFARTGRAAPIAYSTTGNIGTMAGVPIGSFNFNSTSGTLVGPGIFSLGSFAARPLPEGAGLTYHNLPFYINVTFTPAATGSRSATLQIADNAAGSPHSVVLSGTGATAPPPSGNESQPATSAATSRSWISARNCGDTR